MCELYVFGPNGTRLGLLQNTTSVQWMEAFQAPGEAKIEAEATSENRALLACGHRLHAPGFLTAMHITSVEMRQNGAQLLLLARAQGGAALLDGRVLMGSRTVQNAEAGLYALYAENRRGLPIGLAAPKGYAETVDFTAEWGSVLAAQTALAEASGLGFRVLFSPQNGSETFEVYKGLNRTSRESGHYIGHFGDDVGNLTDVQLVLENQRTKNVAVVAGEAPADGALRTVRTVSLQSGLEGAARRELFADAKSLRRTAQLAQATGQLDAAGNPVYTYQKVTYTEAEYAALLDAFGLEKLAAQLPEVDVRCNARQEEILYGRDYFLGDIVPVKLTGCGLRFSALVCGATHVLEGGGEAVSIQLGNFKPL